VKIAWNNATEVLFSVTNEYDDSLSEKQPDDCFPHNTALMELTADLARARQGESVFQRLVTRRGELYVKLARLVLISAVESVCNGLLEISVARRGAECECVD
jgi:hypothetical protein